MKYKFKSEVEVPADSVKLKGEVVIPSGSEVIVLFSHGSGSSRLSPRNNHVALKLHEKNLGTFLFDLLTEEEDEMYENRFDIDLLTERLLIMSRWLLKQPFAKDKAIAYFGASTGAASAIKASLKMDDKIHAIVSRGGRVDLAMDALEKIHTPTLLIVGGNDYIVLDLNKEAFSKMKCEKELLIVDGATHLFEEPGMLDKISESAANWFLKHAGEKIYTEI